MGVGLDDLEKLSNIARNFAQVLAFLVGGAWAYLKFVKGRTFKYRAEIEITASLYSFDEEPAPVVEVTLKNTGLSRIPLSENQALVHWDWLPSSRWMAGANADWVEVLSESVERQEPVPVLATPPSGEREAVRPGETLADAEHPQPNDVLVTPLFGEHEAVEPGETLVDKVLVVLPEDPDAGFAVAYRARVLVIARRRWKKYIQWSSTAIIPTSQLYQVTQPQPGESAGRSGG
jgi:hypothetical protein